MGFGIKTKIKGYIKMLIRSKSISAERNFERQNNLMMYPASCRVPLTVGEISMFENLWGGGNK